MSSITDSPDKSVGYVSLVRDNRDFRYLWLGQIVSLLGDWFNLIASASLIAELTQSGLAIGALFVVRMLAPFLVTPVAGVVADRYNRRRILIITDVTRAVVVLGFLLVRSAEHIWLLYALTAVQLGISGFFFPTRNAILPDVVSADELGAANALSSATWSVMLALGAALGGLVSGIWGARPAFVIDALTFLLSAVFILQISRTHITNSNSDDNSVGAAFRQYIDGLRYLGHYPDILIISLHKGANALLVSSSFQVVQVSIAEKIFVIGNGGGISLGLLFTMSGIGTGLGPILARRFTGDQDRPLRRAISIAYLISVLGLAIASTLSSFPVVLLGALLRGVGGGIVWVFSTQLLLQLVPNEVRGRIFASEYAIFTLMSATAAAAIGGAIDASLSISTILLWMAGLTVIPTILWTMWVLINSQTGLATNDQTMTAD